MIYELERVKYTYSLDLSVMKKLLEGHKDDDLNYKLLNSLIGIPEDLKTLYHIYRNDNDEITKVEITTDFNLDDILMKEMF